MKYLIFSFTFLIIGCDEANKTRLPTQATNIKEYGNGWFEFTLSNKRFLYHVDNPNMNSSMESLTQIQD